MSNICSFFIFLAPFLQRYNYLNDLPYLDPELYRHLIFLKHFEGDISGLELYFVIVNNEYGEQTEEELLQGGRNMRVKNENVITFIHLIANHRLNFQTQQQSSHFLRGFQQLIQKDWIDMFNEHELQLLISGSVDGFDIDDLRAHANYAGGCMHFLMLYVCHFFSASSSVQIVATWKVCSRKRYRRRFGETGDKAIATLLRV